GDGQGVGDVYFTAGQSDRALQARGKDDLIGAGVAIGVEHGLAQRAVATVSEVADQESAGQGAVLEDQQAGHEGAPLGGPAGRLPAGTAAQPRKERTSHDSNLPM